ncbi:MAG: hypothetical protein JJLCMIEE_02410 [Acidimicrobiales bacterium]|nr:MAG: maleylpyruvate isomerase family mycothiol-dependent enzyme [Actinomycetota bacterium]MBV6509341.1 hypothetical protein [Acidimicrobiales bacterium]
MNYTDHVAAVSKELGVLVATVSDGPLDVPVPSCPAWTLADLTEHLGFFLVFWTHVLCDGSGRPRTEFTRWDDLPADDEARVAWLDGLASDLQDLLSATEGDTEVWTWFEPDQSGAFVARRCAHELAIHRYDAQAARGSPEPIDAELAVDGMEEIFGPLLRIGDPSGLGSGETLHVHCTDRPGEWLLTMDAGGVGVRREHAKGDMALRGTAGDLELVLYQREPLGTVERLGDEAALQAFYREFTFG